MLFPLARVPFPTSAVLRLLFTHPNHPLRSAPRAGGLGGRGPGESKRVALQAGKGPDGLPPPVPQSHQTEGAEGKRPRIGQRGRRKHGVQNLKNQQLSSFFILNPSNKDHGRRQEHRQCKAETSPLPSPPRQVSSKSQNRRAPLRHSHGLCWDGIPSTQRQERKGVHR